MKYVLRKEDLENVFFKCEFCKAMKRATDAIIIEQPIDVYYDDGSGVVHISKTMVLVCRECAELYIELIK